MRITRKNLPRLLRVQSGFSLIANVLLYSSRTSLRVPGIWQTALHQVLTWQMK
jgi:hypothetical protein